MKFKSPSVFTQFQYFAVFCQPSTPAQNHIKFLRSEHNQISTAINVTFKPPPLSPTNKSLFNLRETKNKKSWFDFWSEIANRFLYRMSSFRQLSICSHKPSSDGKYFSHSLFAITIWIEIEVVISLMVIISIVGIEGLGERTMDINIGVH